MNVHAVVLQFMKDQNVIRLYSFLGVLLIMGSLVIGVSSAVIQRAIDVESIMNMETKGPIRYYHG